MADTNTVQKAALINFNCTTCKRPVIKKKVICVNCKATFHQSCAQRTNCCSKKSTIAYHENESFADDGDDDIEENVTSQDILTNFQWENMKLKATIAEMSTTIELLKEQLHFSRTEVDTLTKQLKQVKNTSILGKYASVDMVNERFHQIINEIHQIKIDLYNKTANSIVSVEKPQCAIDKRLISTGTAADYKKTKNAQLMHDKQLQIMNEIIYLNEDDNKTQHDADDDVFQDGFKLVTHKKRGNKNEKQLNSDSSPKGKPSLNEKRRSKPIVGSGVSSSGNTLVGVPKRNKTSSFHISRLLPGTTVEDVVAFFASTSSEINCEKMSSKHPEVYSSFKITVPNSLTESVMDPNFWPSGVTVNKFFWKRTNQNQVA
ncbi:hypothetical protein Zmor_008445 [Zophobas morio]|uniref:Uncharacterized protein n=1 Tax=Zophobas morio TaxID=2755281 RepID=A0AA38IYU1_9CUCU|nr:hypothetical protein Zmor_008445 [Zophobas morio]